jgi:Asp/Glu/hydantoin racemase
MKRKIALVHASRAAVDPVANYYAEQSPGIEFTNLLDDGVMRMLLAKDWDRALARLAALAQQARDEYGAEAAVLTCSAVPPEALEKLKRSAVIPLIKIDEPMARLAVGAGTRIGVLSTFPSTAETTRELLLAAAREAGVQIELVEMLAADALKALLAGDQSTHDHLFFEACESFRGRVDALVLAQVSMARLADEAERRLGVPVLNSLDSSLDAVKELLG